MLKNSFQKGAIEISTLSGITIITAVVIIIIISVIAVIKYRETVSVIQPVAVITPKLSPAATPIINETADWKIYSNKNWTIKLPLTYEQIGLEDKNITDSFVEKTFQGVNISDFSESATGAFSAIEFKKIQEKPADILFLKHIQSLAEKSKKYDDYFQTDIKLINNPEEIQLDSIIGVKTKLFVFEGCPKYAYWFEKNETEYIEIDVTKCYEIGGPFGIEGITFKQRLSNELELMQILSTFKFLEKDETEAWKTYGNEKYNFEFKYPVAWELNKITDNTVEFKEKRSDKILGSLNCRLVFNLRKNTKEEYSISEEYFIPKPGEIYNGTVMGQANIGGIPSEVEKIYVIDFDKKIKSVAYGYLFKNYVHSKENSGGYYTILKDAGFGALNDFIVLGGFDCSSTNYEEMDIVSLPEYEIAEKILSNFKFTK